nr:capsule assembly Wzi family protein [Vibrio sp. S9_S30]
MISLSSKASPWLEAKDPYLRSDVTLLSDAGLLRSSVNHYPLRWASIGDDLDKSHSDNESLGRANAHVRYALSSAKYSRGNRFAKVVIGNEPSSVGFGQFNQDEWGAYASYEALENSYAFRLSTGYAKQNGDAQFVWDDSYLSLNAGAWLFSVGKLDRWWGQGWQHNLVLGSYSASTADLGVSYIGKNTLLGGWGFEFIVGFADEASFERYSASRLTSKPINWLDMGITYQTWFDGTALNDGDKQFAVDAKVSLPSFMGLYHSIYTEIASTHNTTEAGAYLYGWTGQVDAFKHTWRFVLERQESTAAKVDEHTQSWTNSVYPSSHKGLSRNTYSLDKSTSASLYVQLNNDHKFSVVLQDSYQDQNRHRNTNITYQFPAVAGMVHVGMGYSQQVGDKVNNSTSIWTGYEFRF